MSDTPAEASAPGPAARIAFLDASVLYPATLRNLLMHLAVAGVFRPRWTDKVQKEWMTALLRDRRWFKSSPSVRLVALFACSNFRTS